MFKDWNVIIFIFKCSIKKLMLVISPSKYLLFKSSETVCRVLGFLCLVVTRPFLIRAISRFKSTKIKSIFSIKTQGFELCTLNVCFSFLLKVSLKLFVRNSASNQFITDVSISQVRSKYLKNSLIFDICVLLPNCADERN